MEPIVPAWWARMGYFIGVLAGYALALANRESRHQIYLDEDLKVRQALREIDNPGRP